MDVKYEYELYIILYNLTNSSANPGRQFNMNCTNFTVEEWKSLNLTRSVAATLGVIIIFAIFFDSWCITEHILELISVTVYLYLIIATLLNEIAGVISMEHQ